MYNPRKSPIGTKCMNRVVGRVKVEWVVLCRGGSEYITWTKIQGSKVGRKLTTCNGRYDCDQRIIGRDQWRGRRVSRHLVEISSDRDSRCSGGISSLLHFASFTTYGDLRAIDSGRWGRFPLRLYNLGKCSLPSHLSTSFLRHEIMHAQFPYWVGSAVSTALIHHPTTISPVLVIHYSVGAPLQFLSSGQLGP